MKKILFLLILQAFLPLAVCASKTDSLQLALKKETTIAGKIKLQIQLAESLIDEAPKKSLVYLQQAQALAKKNLRDTSLAFKKEHVHIYDGLASCYNVLGDNKKAIEAGLEAVKLGEKLDDLPLKANSYLSLGHLYNFTGQNELAIQAHRQSLLLFQKNKNNKGVAQAYNNIGVAWYGMGNMDSTTHYCIKALEIRKKGDDKLALAESYNNVSYIYKNMGDIKKCMEYLLEGLKIREEIGDQGDIANSCNNIGYMYERQENYKKALEYYNRSAKIYEKIKRPTQYANTLHNISLLYAKFENNELARKYAHMALKVARESDAQVVVGSALNHLALIADGENKRDEALKLHLESLAIRRKIKDLKGIANSLLNIGELKEKMGDHTEAAKYLEESLSLYRESKSQDGISSCLGRLGDIYFCNKNYEKALPYLKESFELAKKTNLMHVLYPTSRKLAEVYGHKKDYTTAFNYLWQYTLLNDSSAKSENRKFIRDLEEKYKSEQSKKEIELKNIKLAKKDAEIRQKDLADEKKNNLLIFSFGAVALVLVIVFVLYNSNRRRKKANVIISLQKNELEEKNKEVLDSINYAKRLQEAILPSQKFVNDAFRNNHFIYYAPKDIVAGDFYWVEHVDTAQGKILFFAAADCTGHGVPGAMVSVVCSNALNRATKEFNLTEPGKILDKTRDLVLETFARSEGDVKDGMDISLCAWNKNTNEIKWAGANNPLWILRHNEWIVFKGDKQPIGKTENPQPFTTHILQPQTGDMLYLFTDGYADQFGGEKGKKLKQSNFQQLITTVGKLLPGEQHQRLESEFERWKGKFEQTDDVCVLGVRL